MSQITGLLHASVRYLRRILIPRGEEVDLANASCELLTWSLVILAYAISAYQSQLLASFRCHRMTDDVRRRTFCCTSYKIQIVFVHFAYVKLRIHDATGCTAGCTTGCIVYTGFYNSPQCTADRFKCFINR